MQVVDFQAILSTMSELPIAPLHEEGSVLAELVRKHTLSSISAVEPQPTTTQPESSDE